MIELGEGENLLIVGQQFTIPVAERYWHDPPEGGSG